VVRYTLSVRYVVIVDASPTSIADKELPVDWIRFAVVAVWFGVGAAACGRDIYVDNAAGDDRYDGGSRTAQYGRRGALRSLQRATTIARPGDRILVLNTGMSLRESVAIDGRRQPGGTPGYPIVIEGNGAVLDGTIPVEPGDGNAFGFGLFRLDDVGGPTHARDWLFVNGTPAPRGRDGSSTARPQLAVGQFAVWQGWFAFRAEPGKTLADYRFAFSKRDCGVAVYRSGYWKIRDLTIRGFRGEGVQVRGPCTEIAFERCRFEFNGHAGAAVGNLASPTFADCHATHNGRVGVVVNNHARLKLERVKLSDNPKDSIVEIGARVETIAGEPRPAPTGDPGKAPTMETAPATNAEPKKRPTTQSDDDL
jgi:hypothetical protein